MNALKSVAIRVILTENEGATISISGFAVLYIETAHVGNGFVIINRNQVHVI